MEKKITTFNTMSLLSISLLMFASGSLIAPALNALQASFPEVPYSAIRMIMTSMYLTVMIFSLISGQLSKKVPKKTLVLTGFFVYGCMGVVGANMHSIAGLMTARIMMGCGVGLILPGIRKLFKSATPLLACFITGVGFVILTYTGGVITTMIAQCLIGLGNGILIPTVFIAASQIVISRQRQLSMSILSAVMYLGCFMTAYLQTWVGIISGNTSQRFMFLVFGIGAFLAFIIVILLFWSFSKKRIAQKQ